MLDFKPQTQLLSQQDSQGGAQKCPVRVGGDFMLLDSSMSCTWWQMFRIILAIKRQSTISLQELTDFCSDYHPATTNYI